MRQRSEDADRMMVVSVGDTFDENCHLRLYYAPSARGYRGHEFLGLYTRKAVRAVGEIEDVITADLRDGRLVVHASRSGVGKLSPEQESRIRTAMEQATEHGWDITTGHNFFLVHQFIDTNFPKMSHGGLRAKRYFNLREELGTVPTDAVTVAAKLVRHSWE